MASKYFILNGTDAKGKKIRQTIAIGNAPDDMDASAAKELMLTHKPFKHHKGFELTPVLKREAGQMPPQLKADIGTPKIVKVPAPTGTEVEVANINDATPSGTK